MVESDDESFIQLPSEHRISGELEQPRAHPGLITDKAAGWLEYSQENGLNYSLSPLVRFHNEILEFCDYVKLTTEELRARNLVTEQIERIVHSLWPDSTVHVFGSELTGVLLPTSDLDFVVLDCPDDEVDALYALQEQIEAEGLASYIEVISNAKVPIVKMDHASTGIAIDICCNVTNGLNTGRLIKSYISQFPQLMPLTLVLKMFLAQRKLNETYTGGVGSFMLVLMIVSFLQMRRHLSKTRSGAATENLGVLLTDFLELYGKTFNYYTTAISVRDGGYYFSKRQRFDWCVPNRPWALSIENPDQTELDVGKNSYEIRKVKRAFETAHASLICALGSEETHSSYLAYLIRSDDASLVDRPIRRWDRFEMKSTVASSSSHTNDEDTGNDDDDDEDAHFALDSKASDKKSSGKNSKGQELTSKRKKARTAEPATTSTTTTTTKPRKKKRKSKSSNEQDK